MQRGDFIVSVVAELPANRGHLHRLLSRHFASVVGWLYSCFLVVSFAHLQLGEALVRCQHEHRKKASFVPGPQLTFCPALVADRRCVPLLRTTRCSDAQHRSRFWRERESNLQIMSWGFSLTVEVQKNKKNKGRAQPYDCVNKDRIGDQVQILYY